MKKTRITILICSITAVVLGVWGQTISYFLSNNIVAILPIYYLTAITIISVTLFILAFFLSFFLYTNREKGGGIVLIQQLGILAIGIPTSLWSLFVLFMW